MMVSYQAQAAKDRGECVYEGMSSPWGKVDHASMVAPGIGQVGTPGHGGIKLDAKHNAKVPDYMRGKGGWYEEDCDWCIPFVVFEAEILAGGEEYACRNIANGEHIRTFKSWHPDEYERFFGVKVTAEESGVVRDRERRAASKGKLVSLAAWGDWHEKVPEGLVAVVACIDGRLEDGRYAEPEDKHRYFLVPDAEYEARKGSFIVDPTRHQEIDPIR